MSDKEEVDAFPHWYWDCPKCGEMDEDGAADGDFDTKPNGKETYEAQCACGAEFIVVKP